MTAQNTKNKGRCLHYLLVPDAGAARRLRRLLVEESARTGIVVGTWGELLTHACSDYLVPAAGNDWDADLITALRELPDAAWSKSLEVASTETATAVWAATRALLLASAPGEFPRPEDADSVTERARGHLADLARLVNQLDGKLPPDMHAMRALLDSPDEHAIRFTRVYTVADKPRLNVWQSRVIDKLNAAVHSDPKPSLQALLEAAVSPAPSAAVDTCLGTLQASLYAGGEPRSLDESAQWVGVRDARQEAEVAAGMAQQLIADGVEPRRIGLLLPADETYYGVVRQSFDHAGLPLAGLPQPETQRDLGYETVFNFLVCKQRPAPAMALAALLTSPLMPWPRTMGLRLAQTVMDGNYSLATPKVADASADAMLELLRTRHNSPDELAAALSQLAELLPQDDDENVHQGRAQSAIAMLCERVADKGHVDWDALRAVVTPTSITVGDAIEHTLEGVTVWLEEQTPWRPVDHLLVLGFRDRHYPRLPGYSPVFFPEDLRAINAACGIELDTNEALLKRRRACFSAQLNSAGRSVTFLIPRRDAFGKFVAPSSSLLFMAGLCGGIDKPEDLILDIESTSEREQVRRLAIAAPTVATPPRVVIVEHLALGRNLLALRTDRDGNPAPQSPSRLESLIVSPFAWLLGQLRAEPGEWVPDELNVLLKGSIAHDVFERLFPRGQSIPSEEEIQQSLPDIYSSVLRRRAPFMRSAAWHVERGHLLREIADAAVAWREILVSLNASVVDAEFWLSGSFDGHPIHGQVDALLELPDSRLLVVDFKKSKASARRKRMDKGYDAQASLYRRMLETGGPRDDDTGQIATVIKKAESIGVGYFTMNDGRLLADTFVAGTEQLPSWESFDNPVSVNAMDVLRRRFAEVARGEVLLNVVEDEKAFERDMGIKAYAFDNSPLVRLFMRPEGLGGAS